MITMERILFICTAVLTTPIVFAQSNEVPGSTEESAQRVPSYVGRPSDAEEVYAIYPGTGVPSGSENWTWQEQTTTAPIDSSSQMARNIVVPTLTMFEPKNGNPNGTAVIVAPGGAFHFLMMNHEGYDVARHLSEQGITAFVLKYRVAHTTENNEELPEYLNELFADLPQVSQTDVDPPVGFPELEKARLLAEEDGRQAIRFLRTHASDLGIDPNKIGFMGFSAGGGIAVNAALEFDSLSRPNFVGGIYPGYRIVESVPQNLPPLFIAIANDDKLVGPVSSSRLYETWHERNIPVALHIFTNGGHGFGLRDQNLLSDQWFTLFTNWMTAQGFLY